MLKMVQKSLAVMMGHETAPKLMLGAISHGQYGEGEALRDLDQEMAYLSARLGRSV